ncbi:MAG: hypothetical protein V3V08_18410 [Nannocystaceae bacterium]
MPHTSRQASADPVAAVSPVAPVTLVALVALVRRSSLGHWLEIGRTGTGMIIRQLGAGSVVFDERGLAVTLDREGDVG